MIYSLIESSDEDESMSSVKTVTVDKLNKPHGNLTDQVISFNFLAEMQMLNLKKLLQLQENEMRQKDEEISAIKKEHDTAKTKLKNITDSLSNFVEMFKNQIQNEED